MVEKLWFENHPIRYLLWPLLWPLSRLYLLIAKQRRARYQSGSKVRYKASVPVIVVGNITAGGNGKTPMVIWLIEQLQAQGYKPGVVSRGYGGKAERYPLVVEEGTRTSQSGDEPKLIYNRTQVPVVVDPVRSNAVKQVEQMGVDVVITDDGLQHYALDRSFEIVVVDGKRRFGNQQIIPLGPLRESTERLDEVDLIVVNGGQSQRTDEKCFVLNAELAKNLLTGEVLPLSGLGSLAAFAGIGHPPRFLDTLNSLHANVQRFEPFSDHHDFTQQEIMALAQGMDNVVMTEKDAVKCRAFAQDNWWYLPVSAQFSQQDSQQILQQIGKVIESYGSSTT
ncbi:tetraacyldisaccharide 4'-kinase [Vibrio hippocampi]|uniref:Tetraacyldisaccharide 4'-kinase n=1 Tax=Vibrio hippocampi TaxID=654686 RepID=A0ABN8DEQ7_9VIBR|nr:tetraacyldisaccharide 4'-kinase [Vibrio hippocampi]CAH0525566.1 Tetraacyldisaccharide 4'-kinase [Vibrio hippocampi]